ncbi:MAG: J domain-containing protein [Rhodoferax sp.]|uniref:J domain-containing protein n=1 Tax=Rhodoferax sp. TaxID=50421 RepID=UPI002637AF88|nr:J domain-containing protein [Rhodoferax sp.]MDD2881025.1 J domain-containing protein [Rhodoferax sp.]
MKPEPNLYDLLEVSPAASDLVVRAAYRSLTQANHPDKNSGNASASARQAAINHAYFVLSDPLRRQRYDQTLGLAQGFVERRGSDLPKQRQASVPADATQGLRAFVFRPLN